MVTDALREEFAGLFAEFAGSYPATQAGRAHMALYAVGREEGRRNFATICEAAGRGEDVTDAVLLKLIPYPGHASAKAKGAWVHVAPAARADLKKWFENAGWTRADDWPEVTRLSLDFVRRCNDSPDDLPQACRDFAQSPLSKGFQSAMLSPILNALRPDRFIIYNAKSRATINWLSGSSLGQSLVEYPEANERALAIVEGLSDAMDAPGVAELIPTDRFDMFCHWLVAVKEYFEADDEPQADQEPAGGVQYWKIAPGSGANYWDECRDAGFIGIGWEQLGDVGGLTRTKFDERWDQVAPEEEGWTKQGANQVWAFVHIVKGDRIVANWGTDTVLGIGTVTGPYYFAPGEPYGHRLPVRWDDLTWRWVDEYGWRRALIKLDEPKFRSVCQAPPQEDEEEESGGGFTPRTFELLAGLHQDPTQEFYRAHQDEFQVHVEGPFQALMATVAAKLPAPVSDAMETQRHVFSRIPKNDYGRGGAWDFYWGAFYPKGGKRTHDAQLFATILPERMESGFYVGERGGEQRGRFIAACRAHEEDIGDLLGARLSDPALEYGRREDRDRHQVPERRPEWREWLVDPEALDFHIVKVLAKDEVLEHSEDALAEAIAGTFEQLFPLVILASAADPLPAIRSYLGGPPPDPHPPYSVEQCAEDTGLGAEVLQRWVRAIDRKGQAIIYGPPGTGKTYLAERLARHLVGGQQGFWELVQLHPAYAYEDFVQGLRPQGREDGGLDYPLLPGRFLDFCRKAQGTQGPCVLILDEINRANLARVLGELMYLLEYRDAEIPLAAGGSLRIPPNVRLIGTMNTADRSIALVDHALRRRFAFLALYPNYDILRRFHGTTGFDPSGLIEVLQQLNSAIDDRHYEVGVSFFLRPDVGEELQDIWQMEIEPYLEEHFFDQPGRADAFRWSEIEDRIRP